MPTFNQLVRKGRQTSVKKSTAVHTPRFCGEEVLIGFFWRELKLL